VAGPKWPEFLKQQKELLAARTDEAIKGKPALAAKVRLPSGELVDHYAAPFTLQGFNGSSSGPRLHRSTLRWYRAYAMEGKYTLTLSLNGWVSDPVDVEVSQGKVFPDSIIFEMR
jgi:hypothetical protein